MRRRVVILYCIGLAAIMVPILAAILLAAYMSVDRQRDRASAMAADILHRSHKVSDQLAHVFAELSTRQTPDARALRGAKPQSHAQTGDPVEPSSRRGLRCG
jgi:sensor c-di-GMP phosphodiesterase-like protein